MKLYVGNMSFDSSETELRKAFEAFGAVDSVTIIMDRDTGRPRDSDSSRCPTTPKPRRQSRA